MSRNIISVHTYLCPYGDPNFGRYPKKNEAIETAQMRFLNAVVEQKMIVNVGLIYMSETR
jgi:hypothetical protein